MNIFRIIKKSVIIDLSDINYVNNYINSYEDKDSSLFSVLFFLAKRTGNRIWYDVNSLFTKESIESKYICFYGTRNQYISLLPIVENIDNARFCSFKNKNDLNLYTSVGYILSWFFLPLILYKYHTKPVTKENVNLAGFIRTYFFAYGMFIWCAIYFSWVKPKAILIANDHSPYFRLLKLVCKYIEIPICYIQHASVTEKFPKLDFDISFLEGEDALNKYASKGIESKVHLIGMPKFDGYLEKINKSNQLKSLGIAINLLDEKPKIDELLLHINNELDSFEITLRPHPRDGRLSYFKGLCEKYNFNYSDSQTEKPFIFLQHIDTLIACESSIHLEAALMNVYPIYYALGTEIKDVYGYIENGLITDTYKCPDLLIDFLKTLQNKRPDNIRNRCKYYVNTVGTMYDGKSGIFIKKILKDKFMYGG